MLNNWRERGELGEGGAVVVFLIEIYEALFTFKQERVFAL